MSRQHQVYYSLHANDTMKELQVSEREVEETLATGSITPAKLGRLMATKVFTDGYMWRMRYYPHREINVVHVVEPRGITAITIIVRYGIWRDIGEG